MIKRLLLMAAILTVPSLSSAQTICTTTDENGDPESLDLNDSFSLEEVHSKDVESVTFTCPHVVLKSSGNVNMTDQGSSVVSDNVTWGIKNGVSTITFTSDPTCTETLSGPDVCESGTTSVLESQPVVFSGTFTSGGKSISVLFTAASDHDPSVIGPDSESDTFSVQQAPEPGTMLLFGTGLLMAGGILRRRLLHA